MRLPKPNGETGIALIIVMVSIFVLAVLAGGFAYSMKVETKLARNSQFDDQLVWLGRSGVEVARLVLASTTEPFDARMQYWAGGPGGLSESNSAIAWLELDNWHVGDGAISFSLDGNSVSVKITDEERKMNINMADEAILRQAMMLIGGDLTDTATVMDSIRDWIDPDDLRHPNGWEDRDYQSLPRPYYAKNGPLDDMSELLLINGVTPELYWGPHLEAHPEAQVTRVLGNTRRGRLNPGEVLTYPVGLVDLFCCLSLGQINVNTADPIVLQLIPGVDEAAAHEIVRLRAGLDGVDGSGDDVPFENPGQLATLGLPPLMVAAMQPYCTVRSSTFTVSVEAKAGDVTRHYRALVRRNGLRDVALLFMEAE